jgi:hypothetical protein
MPSTSAKQAKFMRAVAHSPKFAKKVGVAQSVGKDFEMADKKMKKFKGGGPLLESQRKPIDVRRAVLGSDKEIVERGNRTPYEPMPKPERPAPKRKPLGRAGAAGYKEGGKVMGKSDKAGRALVKKSADTMGRAMMKKAGGGKCYAKGGSVSSRADGCATKGKTHTKMVAMKRGGKC